MAPIISLVNKNDKSTSWTEATTNPANAIISLISCMEAGYNAWIEIQKNGEQVFPIKMKNPELDNPFNWTMSYGVPTNSKELHEQIYFNETQKDLTLNWTAAFGEKEAIKKYQETGELVKGLLNTSGICHPVKKVDANKYRTDIVGDDYIYGFWTTYWKPKDGIPYWVIDESIEKVFVVCYNTEEVEKKEALIKAGQFLIEYGNSL